MPFNAKVHSRDPKSGRVNGENAYRRICKAVEGGGTIELNERPVGSGIWYNSDGSLNEKESEKGLKAQAAERAAEEARQAELSKSPEQKRKDEIEKARKLIAEVEAEAAKKNSAQGGK